ncbi:MAG: tRNA glutamyl-Q(34) synthetase GluQRS [Alphaproteobacteria bacterium]|nr:tRNA glutamyl-Q(34) synthetase GluQRS [Alphaproteobacteria bacterium]
MDEFEASLRLPGASRCETIGPITRFAPSPTGYLHLGHAFAALFAAAAAARDHGRFLLRIEDIDRRRCRREFETALLEDLRWLGLYWAEPVRRQSEVMETYRAALARLEAMDLVYPCFCSRKEILDEIAAIGAAPQGPDGVIYPGTCLRLAHPERRRRQAEGQPFALRLNMTRALAMVPPLTWYDRGQGVVIADPGMFGDIVLARKDTPASYHLAVTVDDHIQGVTLVTRGNDLFRATHIHRLLQALLGLDTPDYHHHELIADSDGRRLAKRDQAPTLRALRAAGHNPKEIRIRLGFS